MKLQFKNQAFQEAATAAVCDVFEGQPYHDPNKYTVDPGKIAASGQLSVASSEASLPGFETLQQGRLALPDDPPDVGYKNAEIELQLDVLRKNLHAVQDRQNLIAANMVTFLKICRTCRMIRSLVNRCCTGMEPLKFLK